MTIIVTETAAIAPAGAVTGRSIIDTAARTLQDESHKTWPREELLAYLNDGQRDACIVKVDAYVKNEALQLVAGTRQDLPVTGTAFMRLVCNVDGAGVRGRAPRLIDLTSMDMQNPTWHSDPASTIVMEYGYDGRDPKRFYVSPPQPTTGMGKVEAVFGAVPPDLESEDEQIALDGIYKTALVNYVIYRAYLKEGELTDNAGAMAHRAEFLNLLGAKGTAEAKVEAK